MTVFGIEFFIGKKQENISYIEFHKAFGHFGRLYYFNHKLVNKHLKEKLNRIKDYE